MKDITRRSFLEFLGISSTALLANPTAFASKVSLPAFSKLKALAPSELDELGLADGLSYEVLIKWGETIGKKKMKFGFNNDYIAFVQLDENNPDDGILWVNHEYVDPKFVSGFLGDDLSLKTKAQVKKEMYNVGGSLVRVKKIFARV